MEVYISQIKLPDTGEFSQRFNSVSDAFTRWEESIGTEHEDRLWAEYFSMKYCLEQGLPFGTTIIE